MVAKCMQVCAQLDEASKSRLEREELSWWEVSKVNKWNLPPAFSQAVATCSTRILCKRADGFDVCRLPCQRISRSVGETAGGSREHGTKLRSIAPAVSDWSAERIESGHLPNVE